MLKAIPTTFEGREYRSRLEARWAVFLRRLGVRFEYEVEGYELESGRYLPDFYLPEIYPETRTELAGAYLEVKPPGGKAKHARALQGDSRKPVLVSAGSPPHLIRGRLTYCHDCGRLYASGPGSASDGLWLCEEHGHLEGSFRRVDMSILLLVAEEAAVGMRFDTPRPDGVRMTNRGIMSDRLEPVAMTPAQLEAQRAARRAMMPASDQAAAQQIAVLEAEAQRIQRAIASGDASDAVLSRKMDVARKLDRLKSGR